MSSALWFSKNSTKRGNAAGAVYTPALTGAASLFSFRCGALSVPKKNFGLPERAASIMRLLSEGRLAIGMHRLCGFLITSSRVIYKWCTVIVAAI